MPEFGGRIDALKIAIDSAYVWYKAVQIIKKETGLELEDEPEKAMAAAKKKLEELEKLNK